MVHLFLVFNELVCTFFNPTEDGARVYTKQFAFLFKTGC